MLVWFADLLLGIGNSLAWAYVARPNCTVLGSIRDDAALGVTELRAFPKGNGSRLLLVKIESFSPTDANNTVKEMKAAGIDHIDILIPNTGVSPPVDPLEMVDPRVVASTFHINALGSLSL
ncbi:hypothetical protein AAE478_010088 [Parahypoxylon ruwenzoriense]